MNRPRRRVEVAEAFLRRGMEHVGEDPVQACEKLYKAAEEALKALAEVLQLEAFREAENRRGWTSSLYFEAVEEASKRLGRNLARLWDAAWTLHVEGFHEMNLTAEDVRRHARRVRELVELAKALASRRDI